MSKKKAAGNQVGQVPSPSLLQEGHVCYLEATRWTSAGLDAAVLEAVGFLGFSPHQPLFIPGG